MHACERELIWLDMLINCKKSFCFRVGQRCDAVYANVVNYCSQSISWVTEIRYLGIYFASSRSLKCTLDIAKRSFYRTANAILGKVGRAPEDVILELIRSKCLPALLYGLGACPVRKSDVMQFVRFCCESLFHEIVSDK